MPKLTIPHFFHHSNTSTQPSPWLLQLLTQHQVSSWNSWRSSRAALSIGAPMAIGFVTDQLSICMWLAMASMLQITGERDGSYRYSFYKIILSAAFASLGLLLGYLSNLPWGWVVLIMALIGFCSALLSSINALLSVGTLQMLIMGTVAIGNPALTNYGQAAGFILLGSAWYAALLGIEAMFRRHHPTHQTIATVLTACQQLAQASTEAPRAVVEQREHDFTSAQENLYAFMFQTRSHAQGRNPESERLSALLQRFEALFSALLSTHNPNELRAASDYLALLSEHYHNYHTFKTKTATDKALPALSLPTVLTQNNVLSFALSKLTTALLPNFQGATEEASPSTTATSSYSLQSKETSAPTKSSNHSWLSRFRVARSQLSIAPEVLRNAYALMLCCALGFSLHWFDNGSHWYWAPLTIFLVMKPDLGSIFSRTILRCVGTSLGVLVGALALHYVPFNGFYIVVMVFFAACLPWAIQHSYIMMNIFLTPIILMLIESVSPHQSGLHPNFAFLRFENTLIGGAIVLVFGYLIWPKTHREQLSRSFSQLRHSLSRYLLSSVNLGVALRDKNQTTNATAPSLSPRREVYRQLNSLRATLQRQLIDPPPARNEALAWYPLISSASRVADAITVYTSQATQPLTTDEQSQLQQLANWLDHGQIQATELSSTQSSQSLGTVPTALGDLPNEAPSQPADSAAQTLINQLISELQHAHGLSAASQVPSAHIKPSQKA